MRMNKKIRNLIVSENDITTVISVINKESSRSLRTGNCGWAEEPDKWFVIFDMSEKRFDNVLKSLHKIGTINMKFRPGGQKDLYFERA